jgi:hypothetical protein
MKRNPGLFPNENEVAAMLSQDPKSWPEKAIVLERDGFPKIEPLMGGRFFPAIVAFWNRRYGLHASPTVADGKDDYGQL